MWVLLCSRWSAAHLKSSPQIRHLYVRPDLCVCLCLSSDCLKEKHCPHWEQEKGCSPVWIRRWALSKDWNLKLFPQSAHINCPSSVSACREEFSSAVSAEWTVSMCCRTCISSEWWKEHFGQEKAAGEVSAEEPYGQNTMIRNWSKEMNTVRRSANIISFWIFAFSRNSYITAAGSPCSRFYSSFALARFFLVRMSLLCRFRHTTVCFLTAQSAAAAHVSHLHVQCCPGGREPCPKLPLWEIIVHVSAAEMTDQLSL